MSDSIEEYNRKSNEFTSNYSANSATEEMEELSKFDISTSNEIVGKGRGRGRGAGVPLLPEGLWKSINSNDAAFSKDDEDIIIEKREENKKSNQNYDDVKMVKEFTGRDRGSNGGFGGRGRGRGRGKPNSNGVDWNCVECDNLNWSWRTTCNKCNAGRPVTFIVGDNEVREGKAGGFDERQDRVSKAALEIDEEGYDDFGRRLSKSRNDKRAKEEAALKRLQQSYGFLLQGDDGDNENNITKDIESHPHKSESVKHNVNAGKEDNQRADDSKSKSNYNDKPVMSKARENNDTKRDRDRRDEGSMLKSDYTDKKHRADEFDKNRESRDEKNRDNQRDRDRDADRDHHIDKDKDRERDRHTRVSKSRDRYGLEHSDSRGRRDRYPSNKIVHGDSRGSNSNRRSNSRNRNSSDSYRRN